VHRRNPQEALVQVRVAPLSGRFVLDRVLSSSTMLRLTDQNELATRRNEGIVPAFVSYKRQEPHDVHQDGWEGRSATERVIEDARRRARS